MTRAYKSSLLQSDGINHGFFTRRGGVSRGLYASANMGTGSNDNRDHVLKNRQSALDYLSDRAIGLNVLYQDHGSRVIVANEPWQWHEAPRADAIVTGKRGLAIGILTADCTPILMLEKEAGIVAAAHGGWKGALQGIIANSVSAMEKLGARVENIRAAIGPVISQSSYEVGPELRQAFVEAEPASIRFFERGDGDRYHLDLEAYIGEQLTKAGVQNIDRLGLDTYARDQDFYSYRRATHRHEPDYGRQLSAILIL